MHGVFPADPAASRQAADRAPLIDLSNAVSVMKRGLYYTVHRRGEDAPSGAVAVEDQPDRVRAFACRDRRRIAPTVGFQRLSDRARVAGLPSLGFRDELVAPRPEQPQAARHLAQ